VAEVLLEVNVAGDESKSGMAAGELKGVIERAGGLVGVRVAGLMAMASLTGGLDIARRNFAELRGLRERVSPSAPPNVVLKELSMGMSEDFEVAIEEGATMVRVGSALFAGVCEHGT
jgi:PLP dependent protein